MQKDPELHKEVADFNVRNRKFCYQAKTRRRRHFKERGRTPDNFDFQGTELDLTLLDLDALCHRFRIFGLDDRGKTPMLQKLTVNVFPYGINITIPWYWPLDYKRDINWKEITDILKLAGT